MESETTGLWENKRLEELRQGDHVPTPGGDISEQPLPHWFDTQKFDRAKKVYKENFASINFSHLCGLLLSFYFTKNIKTLKSTGESKNKTSLFHRYLQTIRHTQKWYEGNILDTNDPAHRSLSIVRALHAQVGKKMSSLNDGIVYVSQWDMALTQWAFIGPIVLFRSQVGLHGLDDMDYNSLIHFWRVVGYYLGIKDQYNLCHGDFSQVVSACETILHKEYKGQIRKASPVSVDMGRNVVAALTLMDPMLTWKSMSTYMHGLVNLPCPEVLGIKDWISLYFMRFAFYVITRYAALRNMFNDLTRWRINMAEKKDLKMLTSSFNATGG